MLVPAAMAVMGRGNWWWPSRPVLRRRKAFTVARPEIALAVRDGRVVVRDLEPV